MNNRTFKLYENKDSSKKTYTRMSSGGEVETIGNLLGWWEKRSLPRDHSTDFTIILGETLHKRPHLVAHKYFGDSRLFWLVLQYNNIVDIEEEFVKGAEIILPTKNRALTVLVS